MNKRILVRISTAGEITVEAEGFKGKGCEAATKAIEEALGKTEIRKRKPNYWRQTQRTKNHQTLGGEQG